MQNLNNLCGCRPEKLANRSTEENLKECSICGILNSCPYPKSAAMRMVKSAVDETPKNLKELASKCHDFGDFHARAQKQDRLNRPERSQKNLQQLARESLYFGEFCEKADQIEDDNK